MMKKVLMIVAIVALLIAGIIIISQPTDTRGEVNFTTESPHAMLRRSIREKVKITQVRHRIRFREVSPAGGRARASGSCYRVDATVIGENKLIDEIVTGTMHAHWCVKAGNPNAIYDRYTYANSDHHESWGWTLDGIEVAKGAGLSTTWCLDPGEIGPCPAHVEYRYWRFRFGWERGISVFGQEFKMHKHLYVSCTVRGDPGGYLCKTGEG